MSEYSSQKRTESVESVEKFDSVVVALRDTLREVTTITIQTNDRGDTLRVTQITDRTKARSRHDMATYSTKTEVRVDTVIVEKRDSVFVSNTDFTNRTEKKESFWTRIQKTLKWVFAVICAGIVLIITIKICWRKGLF